MFITKEMDYGIRILRALSKVEKLSAAEIRKQEHIPETYIYVLLNNLSKLSLVKAIRGRYGGYALNVDLSKTTLRDVFDVMDRTTSIAECLEDDYDCVVHINKHCGVRDELTRIQDILNAELMKTTLSEIFESKCSGGHCSEK